MTSAVFVTGLGRGASLPLNDGLLYGIGPGGLTRGIDWWIDTVAFFGPGRRAIVGALIFLTGFGVGYGLLSPSCCFFAMACLILSMIACLSGLGRGAGYGLSGTSFFTSIPGSGPGDGIAFGVGVGTGLIGIFTTWFPW